MSTTTTPASSHASRGDLSGLTFGGILKSEWIKLASLRSTLWCYGLMIAITIGFGVLVALTFPVSPGDAPSAGIAQGTAVQVATLAIGFTALVSVVLGALVITGEYGTGMIRSTLTAVPTRLPALFGKVLVFGSTTFVVGLISIIGAALVTAPLLPRIGMTPDFADPLYLLALVGGAGYLALIGVLGLAIGAILRHSAGAIATAIGLILVVPTIILILSGITQADWLADVGTFLPDAAGTRMFSYSQEGLGTVPGMLLEPWQGLLVLLAWNAALLLVAALLLKRRDA